MSKRKRAEDEGDEQFKVSFGEKSIDCERHGPKDAVSLVFTHGAGGGISDGGTRDFARGYGAVSPVVTFQGSLNLKSRIRAFHTVIDHENRQTALGGRSMGARAAVLTALEQEQKAKVLILVSYPLLAGGKNAGREPERREQILIDLSEDTEVLFMVGNEDAQCPLDQLSEMREKMTAKSWLVVVEGADHGMTMKPKAGTEAMRIETGSLAAEWLKHHNEAHRHCNLSWDREKKEVVRGDWT